MPKAKTTKKVKTPKPSEVMGVISDNLFFVTLKIDTKIYEESDMNLVAAIRRLKPENYKAKGILIVTRGDKKVEKVMPLQKLKMLNFQSEIPAIVLAKNLQLLMK